MQKIITSLTFFTLIIISQIFIVISCKSGETLEEKVLKMPEAKVLKLLKTGDVKERRAAAYALKLQPKNIYISNLMYSLFNDKDDLTAAYCADALGQLDSKTAKQFLFDAALGFSGMRFESSISGMINNGVTNALKEKLSQLLKKRPESLRVLTSVLKSSDNENVRKLWLEVLENHQLFPAQSVAKTVLIMGELLEVRSLEFIYQIYFSSNDKDITTACIKVIDSFPDEMKKSYADAFDAVLTQTSNSRALELERREVTRLKRLERLEPPMAYDEISSKALSQDIIFVNKLEIVKDYSSAGHPGGFNSTENCGELIEYKIHIENFSDLEFTKLSGYCYSYSPSVQVLNHKLNFPMLSPSSSAISENSLFVLISDVALIEEPIELFFELGESSKGDRETVLYSLFEITVKELPIGPFEFSVSAIDDDEWGNSEGNGDGILNWGEKTEIEIAVKNQGDKTIEIAEVNLVSLNYLAKVNQEFVVLKNIEPDKKQTASFDFKLRAGYEGKYTVEFLVQFSVIKENKIAGRWVQKLHVIVESSQPKLVGKISSYKTLSLDELIQYFVVFAENKDFQERYLFNMEVDFNDAKDSMLSESASE